jgi:hypothetical protein
MEELGPKANTEGDLLLFNNPLPASSLPPIGPVTVSANIPSSSSFPATVSTISGIDPVPTVASSSPLVNEVKMPTTNQLFDIPVATDMLTSQVARELQERNAFDPTDALAVSGSINSIASINVTGEPPGTSDNVRDEAANASSPEDGALISRNGMPCVRISSSHLIIYLEVIT